MADPLENPLEDADLKHEVELVSDLMVAAGESDDPLTREDIDRLLGVTPAPAATETAPRGGRGE